MIRSYFFIVLLLLGLGACQKPYTYTAKVADSSVGVSGEIKPDAEVAAIIAPFQEKLAAQMKEVIGEAEVDLTRNFEQGESLLGNFCAELLHQQAEKYGGADLSVVTIGGLRVPIATGAVNVGLVYELMPFDNEYVIVKISGETVEKLVKRLAETDNTSLGNVTATIRRGQVVSAAVGGQKIDKSKTYRLAVSDYLANGGDYMDFLKENQGIESTGVKVRDVIINHFRDLTKEGKKATAKLGACITYE
ncbi:MAG: 5'-nucleotidase C-terminal domain-containing protein [Flammeovirgaceae bacterium]